MVLRILASVAIPSVSPGLCPHSGTYLRSLPSSDFWFFGLTLASSLSDDKNGAKPDTFAAGVLI